MSLKGIKIMKNSLVLLFVISILLALSCSIGTPANNDNPNTVTDIDGNVYTTVTIGSQVWTVENLRVTHYNDGTPIPHVTDSAAWDNNTSGAYCYYNNDSVTYAYKYGALYNWHVVNTDKLAPAGWHVPDTTNWIELEQYLIANGYNWDGTTDSNKIAKSMAAKTDWDTLFAIIGDVGNDLSLNNSSGFSALPSGLRDLLSNIGDFHGIGKTVLWWSATEYSASTAKGYFLVRNYHFLDKFMFNKNLGVSVRLVKV